MDYEIDYVMQTEIEAAVFRRLAAHLRQHTEVQNIDLMNLAGFCRNCLGNWFAEAANERGLPLTREDAREKVYGMPYAEWKALYQTEAPAAAQAAFEARGGEALGIDGAQDGGPGSGSVRTAPRSGSPSA